MNKLICLIFIVSLASCQSPPQNTPNSQELDAIHKNLDDYFSALTELQEFNGVVLAFWHDKLVLEKAYNIYENPDSSSFVTIKHQFDIHSISKLMAYYLISKLEAKGSLTKAQTIEKFYPDFPKGEAITVEMLLNHRSGLPRELLGLEGNEIDLSSEEIIGLAKKQKLLFEPGKDTQYSNIGYEILYDIISTIYKKPFAQCIIDEVFTPLQMNSSGAHFFANTDRKQNLAKNHVLRDGHMAQVPNILPDEFKTSRFFSTASDLNMFLNEVKNEPYRSDLKKTNEVIAKDGGSDGIRAQIYTDLKDDFSFVLLANYDEMPFFKTIEDVVKIMKHEAFELPKELNRKPIELERQILERYVGSYSFADFDGLILTIAIEENKLSVFQDGEKIATLVAETETVFFEDPKAPESFEFIKNEVGSFDALMGWKGIAVEGKRR
ncbi:MAG: beta-lactamase family protein [Bacteroidia bacterium]|nr:beta-lactamase family protein [Bacteroidia bacterium]